MGVHCGRGVSLEEAGAVQIAGMFLGVMALSLPQANGHVSQDQGEPVYPESAARAPAEDETQVGPLRVCAFALVLSLVFLGFYWEPFNGLR